MLFVIVLDFRFATSQILCRGLAQRTGCKGMTRLESKDDVLRYGCWMDLEQEVDHPPFVASWHQV